MSLKLAELQVGDLLNMFKREMAAIQQTKETA